MRSIQQFVLTDREECQKINQGRKKWLWIPLTHLCFDSRYNGDRARWIAGCGVKRMLANRQKSRDFYRYQSPLGFGNSCTAEIRNRTLKSLDQNNSGFVRKVRHQTYRVAWNSAASSFCGFFHGHDPQHKVPAKNPWLKKPAKIYSDSCKELSISSINQNCVGI